MDRSVGWLVGWLVGRLVGWSDDWLVMRKGLVHFISAVRYHKTQVISEFANASISVSKLSSGQKTSAFNSLRQS
jgi:hypothetical protein